MIRVVTGNGGGFGDPRKRDPDLVRRDVKNGLISAARAEEVYGITVESDDPDGPVDPDNGRTA